MKINKLIGGILVLASTLCAQSVMAQSRSFDEIKKSGVLQLATEGAFPPFNYYQGTKLVGFEIDVAEEIAKRLDLKIEWKALPFDALIAAVRQGRFDAAIASHGFTEERAKAVDFTTPHYCSGGQIVSMKNGPKTVADLNGKVVTVQLASTYADAAQKISGLKEVKTLPKDTDALSNLMAGRADAWISDRFVAQAAVKKNPAAGLQMGDMVFEEKISFIFAKGGDLRFPIARTIADMRKDGTLAKIGTQWFGQDISCK